jgi:hypothetical protein
VSLHSRHPHADPPTEWAPLEPEPGPATPPPGEFDLGPVPATRARGLPLTDTMPLTTPDGVRWIAYVEGFPRESPRFRHRTILPGRRLRFDSASGSWISPVVPAGAPFLSQARLRELLRRAQPFPSPATPPRIPTCVVIWRWMAGRLARAVRWGFAMAGETHRRWREDRASAAARLHLAMASIRRRG